MSAKKSRFDTRTLIYILLIVVIIAGIGYFILTYKQTEQPYKVPTILSNPKNYNGSIISVEGIYYTVSNSEVYLIDVYPTVANENPENRLPLNLDNLEEYIRINLTEQQQYIAKGTFIVSEYGFFELFVDEIKLS